LKRVVVQDYLALCNAFLTRFNVTGAQGHGSLVLRLAETPHHSRILEKDEH